MPLRQAHGFIQELREKWEIRASARNPKRIKVWRMPAQAGDGTNKPTHWFLGQERCAVARYAPPHTPGCVRVPSLHVNSSCRAARRPKP